MPGNITVPQASFLVILLVAFSLLITERLRNDLVALVIILALSLTGVLTPAEAFSGFGSEPAIVVACIFVLSGAFHHTRLDERISRWIAHIAGGKEHRIIAVVMPLVALLSAFTHHVTTTAL